MAALKEVNKMLGFTRILLLSSHNLKRRGMQVGAMTLDAKNCVRWQTSDIDLNFKSNHSRRSDPNFEMH